MSAVALLSRPLLPIDETRYLTVAWESHQEGNHLVSHLNGETYAHKPPLLFWLINAVWKITGVSGLTRHSGWNKDGRYETQDLHDPAHEAVVAAYAEVRSP